jgi:hypothetical protein
MAAPVDHAASLAVKIDSLATGPHLLQIGEDLRLQYELGYKSPATQPNSYHKLELKAKDKKLMVQARKGFFEPP